MHAFISHSSKDKPAVERLALALRDRGIDTWFDKWEIGPGDDVVASINVGLEESDAGIIVFSRHSRESRWVEAEISHLTYARIQERKVLIPVMIGDDAWVPPLLRPLARRGIEEIEAIADALLGLPFEALRLPDERLLATHPSVVMLRRPWDLAASAGQPLAGPLKIIVAVAASDEGHIGSAVLDQELSYRTSSTRSSRRSGTIPEADSLACRDRS